MVGVRARREGGQLLQGLWAGGLGLLQVGDAGGFVINVPGGQGATPSGQMRQRFDMGWLENHGRRCMEAASGAGHDCEQRGDRDSWGEGGLTPCYPQPPRNKLTILPRPKPSPLITPSPHPYLCGFRSSSFLTPTPLRTPHHPAPPTRAAVNPPASRQLPSRADGPPKPQPYPITPHHPIAPHHPTCAASDPPASRQLPPSADGPPETRYPP